MITKDSGVDASPKGQEFALSENAFKNLSEIEQRGMLLITLSPSFSREEKAIILSIIASKIYNKERLEKLISTLINEQKERKKIPTSLLAETKPIVDKYKLIMEKKENIKRSNLDAVSIDKLKQDFLKTKKLKKDIWKFQYKIKQIKQEFDDIKKIEELETEINNI